MNKHNQEILECLQDYLKIKKPGYAVLLKGSWGCGKTYFIKNWIGSLKTEKNDNELYYTLNPIYISLYGMTATSQIDEELKRAVSPILHSKAMKVASKVFKIAISAALRYNIDLDKNGEADLKMDCTIDPKALLGSNDPHVKGNRLLVFDDIERSNMDAIDVLGYINYYVEHIGCNVVIVGDDDKLKDKNEFNAKKEKTIGREFELDPDVDAAVDNFVQDENMLNKEYISAHKDIIKACFKVSGTNNLRLLKQSLDDYSLMMGRIPNRIKRNPVFEKLELRLLANFVAVYAEDKGHSVDMDDYGKKLGEEMSNQMFLDLTGDDKAEKSEMVKKHEKYKQSGLTDSYYVMVPGYADCVLLYLRKGKVNLDFIEMELKKDEKKPWEILQNYMSLENDVLTKNVDLNAGYLDGGEFSNVDEMLSSAIIMLMIIHRHLTHKYNGDMVNKWCSKIMRERFYGKCKNQNELHEVRQHVISFCGYYSYGTDKVPVISSFIQELGKVYNEINETLKNDLSVMLESLNDKKADELYEVYGGVMPDHSTSYSSSAIFANVDPEKFVNGFARLKNEGKKKVLSIIVGHYTSALDIQSPETMVYHYVDDLKSLPEIIKLLELKANECQLVDKMNILMLKTNLEKSMEKIKIADAIRRGIKGT